MDGDAIFEESELLEALVALEGAGDEGREALEGDFAVGVEADVLPVNGLLGVAVVGDGGAGEVEGLTVVCGHYFYGVRIGDVAGSAADFEGRDLDFGRGEGCQQSGEVFGAEERLIPLNVDIDGGGDEVGDGVNTVGSAGEIGRGEEDGPVMLAAEAGYFFGVGGDEDMVELGAGAGGLVDPGEHRFAGDRAQDLAGETGGMEAGRNDAKDGSGVLSGGGGIGYHEGWLCRGDLSSVWSRATSDPAQFLNIQAV